MKGYIYIFSNPSYKGCLKIGKARNPRLRVKQLSGETGVLRKFRIEAFFKVSDYTVDEQKAHSLLASYREKPNKEFFRLSPEDAILKLSSLFGPPRYIRKHYQANLSDRIKQIERMDEERQKLILRNKEERKLEVEKINDMKHKQRIKIKLLLVSLVVSLLICGWAYMKS